MKDQLLEDIETFKLAVDSSDSHIVITDIDGKILYANQSVSKITGYDNSEIIGQTPALWGRQMTPEFYKEMWDTIKVKQQHFHGEIKNKRKNGEIYYAMSVISPILDKEKKLIGFIGTEDDITPQKEKENLLKEQNAELKILTDSMLGREGKIAELKEELEKLKKKLNPEYN